MTNWSDTGCNNESPRAAFRGQKLARNAPRMSSGKKALLIKIGGVSSTERGNFFQDFQPSNGGKINLEKPDTALLVEIRFR